MCAMCRSYPCVPACPNAPEPRTYGVCKICKEEILGWEEVADIDGNLCHYDCLSVSELLKIFEIEVKEAGDLLG